MNKLSKIPSVFMLICLFVSYGLSQTNSTFFLGHSLVNFHMPNMVNKLSIAAEDNFNYEANIGIGANLLMHWTNPGSGQGAQWNLTLNQGGFENFVITEAVPLKGHLQWSKTYRCADSLYMFAEQYNPNIQYYIYETWHCINSGTPTGCEWDNDDHISWRNRLTLDLPLWEGIADSINLLHEKDMLIIPAGQALARLYDNILAGNVPGFSSINQLFTDDIHLTYTGNYFLACVMYAVLQKKSPEGLPNRLTDEWGSLYENFPTPAQALKFQQIAWETILAYPRDGVNGMPLTINVISLISKINADNLPEICWTIKDDGESNYFVVERSFDGDNFETASDRIYKKASQVYFFTDENFVATPSYYRLKIISNTNAVTYSKVIKINIIRTTSVKIKSNIVTDELELLSDEHFKKLDLLIVGVDGKKYLDQTMSRVSKNQIETIDISLLPTGIYFLSVSDSSSTIYQVKFVKARY